jgi:ribosomal-protein-alanine N-acetyltransferase
MQTKRLILLPAQPEHLISLINGEASFAGVYDHIAEGYNEFPEALEYSLKQLQAGNAQAEWSAHLFIAQAKRTLIGIGGYYGAPDENGMVEIGYGIAPEYRGQGYATEAARGLIERAFADARTRLVQAHTLAHDNPSTSVLKKCGMIKAGEDIDPDEGVVWRWEVRRQGDWS